MRARRLPLVVALGLAAACGGGDDDGGSTGATVDGREVNATVECSVAQAGQVLPESLGNGCTREGGEVYVPGLTTCADGRLLYAEGQGEQVVVGLLGATAEQGQDAFRRLSDECSGAPASATPSSSIPSPSAPEAAALQAALLKIVPTMDREKAVDRARNTCTSITGGVSELQLATSTVTRFSDSDVEVTNAQAEQIVELVRSQPWCK